MAGHDRHRQTGPDPEPSTKRKPEALPDSSKKLDGRSETEDISPVSLESQVELLKDPRLSHTANTEQAARLIKGLQQSRGNAHVQRLLNSRAVQAKLTVHPPGDVYEKEADRVAEMVTQVQQQVQMQEEEEELQMKPAEASVQRQEMPEEEEVQKAFDKDRAAQQRARRSLYKTLVLTPLQQAKDAVSSNPPDLERAKEILHTVCGNIHDFTVTAGLRGREESGQISLWNQVGDIANWIPAINDKSGQELAKKIEIAISNANFLPPYGSGK